MNDKQAIKLAERIEMWQQRLAPLGLAHWRIDAVHVSDQTPGGPDSSASVQPSWQYDSCRFWFREEYVDNCSERDLDETILHEWLHVAMRSFDKAVESVEDALSPGVNEQWSDWVQHERESLVDKLARQIYTAFQEELVQ